jgi:long-chain acyl-CoA synthetase
MIVEFLLTFTLVLFSFVSMYGNLLQDAEDTMNESDEEVLFDEKSSNKNNMSPKRKKSRTGNLLPSLETSLTNSLDHSPHDPLINKLHTMRSTITYCPQIWPILAKFCPTQRALFDEHLCDEKIDMTFAEANIAIRKSASMFQNLGVKKATNVAILGENSAKWILIDHGIQLAGGVSAVRGADAPADELRYIYEHSDSAGIVVLQGIKLFNKLANDAKKLNLDHPLGLYNDSYGPVKTIILMHREKASKEDIEKLGKEYGVNIVVFQDLLDSSDPITDEAIDELNLGKDDVATIVYTSGTTGKPKGVMLTHGNLIHQTGHRLGPSKPWDESEPLPGELMVSLLPVWHITERTFELYMLTRGCSVVYSNIRQFKNDLAKHKPEWLVLVPRVLEKIALGVQEKFTSGSATVKALVKIFTTTSSLRAKHRKISKGLIVGKNGEGGNRLTSRLIVAALSPLNALGDKLIWSKVQDGFGGKNKVIISGGSALAGSLESFYENCGINICVGYGLTECAPLLAHRRSDSNLVTGGCVGQPCIDTELRVVDPEKKSDNEERMPLPDGEVGVVIARGPQIMKGYYKNQEATDKAVDKFGFFDTGDLGRINPATGDLILTGRCKDTIVLSNGENIEPQPIEDAIIGMSGLVEQVMLTGQDGRSLTAILILNPNELGNAGYLDAKSAKSLQKANEKVNDPKCMKEDCAEEIEALQRASMELRKNKDLKSLLMNDIRSTTKEFRKWEQVSDVHISLEPFAMSNGLLTQSYKVKRDAVLNRYKAEML